MESQGQPNRGPGLTIFTIPKGFAGEADLGQRNAIQSWLRLGPDVQVILFGDDPGVAEFAREVGVAHEPNVERNEFGTPLYDSIFRGAHRLAQHPILVHVHADIILLSDFPAAVARVVAAGFEQFLMIGRRTEFKVSQPLAFSAPNWEQELRAGVAQHGVLASRVCKDYFVFTRPLYEDFPPFVVGRGNMDSWMVAHAHKLKVPVIDGSSQILAIHQTHGYSQQAGGRRAIYSTGVEAKRNRELGGGTNLVKGSSVSWKLTASGVRRVALPIAILQLAADAIPFTRLLVDLFLRNKK